MSKLYTELARVYYEMYQSKFDYEANFQLYQRYLQQYDCHSVLELGCGNGNLAPYFLAHGYDYLGIDIAEEMLQIAREVAPNAAFQQGDMRDLHLAQTFDAVIIPGRSFTYMTSNQDVMNALQSIHRTLPDHGLLIFDNFNAEQIMLTPLTASTHTAEYQDRKYTRVSEKSLNLQTGWTWNWKATYSIEEPGKPTKVIEDLSVLRAFTEQELQIFLALNAFRVIETIKAEAVFTVVAQKERKPVAQSF